MGETFMSGGQICVHLEKVRNSFFTTTPTSPLMNSKQTKINNKYVNASGLVLLKQHKPIAHCLCFYWQVGVCICVHARDL